MKAQGGGGIENTARVGLAATKSWLDFRATHAAVTGRQGFGKGGGGKPTQGGARKGVDGTLLAKGTSLFSTDAQLHTGFQGTQSGTTEERAGRRRGHLFLSPKFPE